MLLLHLLVLSNRCNKCITLSILETSLPRQRSHDSLASSICTQNWCVKHNWYNWLDLCNNLLKNFWMYVWPYISLLETKYVLSLQLSSKRPIYLDWWIVSFLPMQYGIPCSQNAMSPAGNLKVTQTLVKVPAKDFLAGHVKVAGVFTGYPPSTAGRS